MKEGLKIRILQYLKNWYAYNPEAWISGLDLEQKALEAGFKPSNGGRRARELAEDGLIERREKNGFVEYKYVAKTYPQLIFDK